MAVAGNPLLQGSCVGEGAAEPSASWQGLPGRLRFRGSRRRGVGGRVKVAKKTLSPAYVITLRSERAVRLGECVSGCLSCEEN